MLKEVNIVGVSENANPRFIKTQVVTAEREGKEFLWEMSVAHSSVHILVDNVDTKELMFVKQVRIPVLVNDDSQKGHVIEACAGLVDKNKDIVEIAREEILEEMGYDIPVDNIEHIRTLKSSVGSSGNNSFAFFAKVTESHKVSNGGGLHDEDILVVRVPYEDVENFVLKESHHTDAITMFLTMWWAYNKNKN